MNIIFYFLANPETMMFQPCYLTKEQCIQAVQTSPESIHSYSPTSIAILWSVVNPGQNPDIWTTDDKGRTGISVELYNSIENTIQVERLRRDKAMGLILRGSGKIGFTTKKLDLLQPGGMGHTVHLERVNLEDTVTGEELNSVEYIYSLVEKLRNLVTRQIGKENVFLDSRHLEQLQDESFPDQLLETFHPIYQKLKDTGVTLQPHLMTYGGGSPRTLMTLGKLLEQLNLGNPDPFNQVVVPEMWGSQNITYDNSLGTNSQALVGYEERNGKYIYYRGQYDDLLE